MQIVILCGGRGTRSYPFTEYFPKPMMPVLGTPILIHLMRTFASQGFDDFILAAGYRKEVLVDYFTGRQSQWSVQIVDTGEESDTGERLRRCRPYLTGRFLATYGDGIGDVDIQALVDEHRRAAALASVTTVPLRSQYGTVEFDSDGFVTAFREKPVIDAVWINAGFFVFEPAVFEHWNGANLESEVLPALATIRQLHVYHHHGFWRSMDTSKDQRELERLAAGSPPWLPRGRSASVA